LPSPSSPSPKKPASQDLRGRDSFGVLAAGGFQTVIDAISFAPTSQAAFWRRAALLPVRVRGRSDHRACGGQHCSPPGRCCARQYH